MDEMDLKRELTFDMSSAYHDGEAEVSAEISGNAEIELMKFPIMKKKDLTMLEDMQAQKWLARFSMGLMKSKSEFKLYWKTFVPMAYSLKENQDCLAPFISNKDNIERVLIEPMVLFLTGGDGSNKFFEFLTGTDRPSTICGRVFQVGEATYTCRECGMDPTCVLCVDCFKSSAHKNHRYKIATSGGGGYCDCGDPEAWKDDVHCDNHMPKEHTEIGHRPEADNLGNRAAILFDHAIRYCYEMTTSELSTRLPDDLKSEKESEEDEKDQLYCTVLYNDETHTFDLVIQTLTRALGCTKKDAIEFATVIDREGRSIVKVGKFQPCLQVQQMIERQTAKSGSKPLKVVVMKAQVIAHQAFALRLLNWLESICSHSAKLRNIVANILLRESESADQFIAEGILLSDTKLWKSARTCWHRLVISALLKEYENKKGFAMLFTRHYADMMKDFIQDDHDHAFSVTSLSVQIFTVPSIAHYLVEDWDVLFTIMRTLLSECEQRLNSKRKLEFDRGSAVNNIFKRTNFAILDLKYVLSSPPTEWSEGMVKNFTHTIDSFLKLLSYMQEMDVVTRQIGQHMEYEPEWESAFNLHIKLQPVVQLSLEWCGSNKTVFIRAFRHCLHDLSKAYGDLKNHTNTLELANHSATAYIYDVGAQPVSVHLPLTRYFAGLYLFLEKYELEFVSIEFNLISCEKPVPEMIIEPALRTQILIAQVYAGMWKRNGYALLNQLYFYHNVRCRTDMLDRDIVTLQIGASLIESNEFLLHVLNRFGLCNWADPKFDERALKSQAPEEDMGKYIAVLSDEFFGLLITIVSARYNPGVGQVTRKDCIKKEVIQQLCVEPMTHSMLNKALVENVNYETGLELVIREVANQNEPTPQRTSVVYELKPEYFSEFDIYHYHFTREEMSKAEERQRERKRLANEPELFPPPQLPPFTSTFNMVVNILQSDVLLNLMGLVLKRSMQGNTRITTESLVRKVLHLIGSGLNEEAARNEKEEEHFFQFSENAKRWKIFELLDEMLKDSSTSQHQDMILWLKQKYVLIKPSERSFHEETVPVVSQANEEEEKERKAKLVKEAKQKMMATMAAAQMKFMAVNKELFTEETSSNGDEQGREFSGMSEDVEMTPLETIALGPEQTLCHMPDERYVCIFCQEDQPLVIGSKRFVLAAFIQRSTVLSEFREKAIQDSALEKEYNFLEERFPLYMNPDLASAPYVSTCGHIMHESCWTSHIDTVFNKERRRPYRHPLSFDVDKDEWLCPMCDSICNAALPMAVPLQKLYPVPPFGRPDDQGCYDDGTVIESDVATPASSENLPIEEGEDTTQSNQVSKEDKLVPLRDPPSPATFDVWIQGMQYVLKKKYNDLRSLEGPDPYEKYMRKTYGIDNPMVYLASESVYDVKRELKEQGNNFEVLYPRRAADVDPSCPTFKWLCGGFYSRLTNFMKLTFTVGLEVKNVIKEEDGEDFRVQLMFFQSLAFSIIAVEAYHRDQNITFFGDEVPNRKAMGLKYLTRACGVSIDRDKQWHGSLRNYALRILTTLLQNPTSSPSLFDCDAFGLLVVLTYSMPALLVWPCRGIPFICVSEEDQLKSADACQPPTGTLLDQHILRLIFMYHVTQVLVANEFTHCIRSYQGNETAETSGVDTIEIDDNEQVESSKKSRSIATRKQYIFGEVWRIAKKEELPWNDMSKIDCEAVWTEICEATIPFLRCCAKFYENLTGIAPARSLEKVHSSFDDLVRYLGLPKTFDDLFDSPFAWQMPYKWASHPLTTTVLSQRRTPKLPGVVDDSNKRVLAKQYPIPYPRRLHNLVDLPDDYTELINMVSNFTCKNCNTLDSRTPTMCLICGDILCSQSYCCQRELKGTPVGACVYHAYYCGGGYGMFLRIRECKLFFIGGKNKGCFMLPPYLDEYGETDQGLRRGNPLSLCKEKYEGYRKIWLQHGIPEEISRVTEHSTTIVATEWQYL